MLPMVAVALLALLAWPAPSAQRKETIIYSRFDLDPGEHRRFEFPTKEKNARLEAEFQVLSPKDSSGVRVVVLREQPEEAPQRPPRPTPYQAEGRIRARLTELGNYVVVVDTRRESKRKTRVELEVTVTTGPDPETLPVRYASPRKRGIVVAVSMAGFLIIVAWSGRVLWRATRRRAEPPPFWS